MKIAIQTANITNKLGIDRGMELISAAGFEALDINVDQLLPGHQIRDGKLSGFFDQPDEEILKWCEPYKAAAAKYGLTFTQAHAPFPNRVESDEANEYVLHAVEKCIMMCADLGCPRIVVHEGFFPWSKRGDDDWEYNINMFTRLIPALRKYGVMCCLENLFSDHRGKLMCGMCCTPEEANMYVDELNRRAGERLFGFCLDVGHALIVGRDIYGFIKGLGDNLSCLHVHDNDGVRDEHLFPYMGILDWDRFCRGLKEINYQGDMDFETFHGFDIFDIELAPEVLALAGATAKLLRKRVIGE